MWLGVAPRMDIKKTCSKEIGPHAQNMIIILGAIVHLVGGMYVAI